ncbi:MAG TPA: FkbM family methyltransferase [Pyrinomonadaceae bacterium]|nr:FkbM family methyltransferase [Pyrinomonadaceae bacterium]
MRKLGVGPVVLNYVITPAQKLAKMRLPDRDVTVESLGNQLLVFSPRKNFIGSALYRTGVWEPAVTAAIAELTRPGMVALDVGADIGYYTLQLSRLVGPTGQVVAFEPIPKARERLEHNISTNGCLNIVVSELALGNQDGTVYLEDPFKKSRLNLNKTTAGDEDIKVTICRLDDLAGDLKLTSVDLVKIDVEGAEHEVLRGMEQTLRRFRPLLVIEVHHQFLPQFGSSAEALLEWIAGLGYEINSVEPEAVTDNVVTSTVCCRAGVAQGNQV